MKTIALLAACLLAVVIAQSPQGGTCVDTIPNCYQYSTYCKGTLYQSFMKANCAFTCRLCTTTTNVCNGLAVGANLGACINNACATGAICNTTTQNCICPTKTTTNACTGLAAGANLGACINNACAAGATCNTTTQNCICLATGR